MTVWINEFGEFVDLLVSYIMTPPWFYLVCLGILICIVYIAKEMMP